MPKFGEAPSAQIDFDTFLPQNFDVDQNDNDGVVMMTSLDTMVDDNDDDDGDEDGRDEGDDDCDTVIVTAAQVLGFILGESTAFSVICPTINSPSSVSTNILQLHFRALIEQSKILFIISLCPTREDIWVLQKMKIFGALCTPKR